MNTIINTRIDEAFNSAKCVDANAKLTALKNGGWKIETTCKVNGKFVDFYGNDGRLQAHLRGEK